MPDGVVRASKADLARCSGLSIRSVHDTIDELLRGIAGDVLELLEAGGADRSNVYCVELLEDLAARIDEKRRPAWAPHIAPLLDGHREVSASTLRRLYAFLLAHRWFDKRAGLLTKFAFPGVEHTARELGLTDRTVQRGFDVLARVGLAERRELGAGELFPHGRRARGGEVLRIVHVIAPARRVPRGTATASPPPCAMPSVQGSPSTATPSGGTATATPEVLTTEDPDPGEKTIARAEPDAARTVVEAYARRVFPRSSPSDFVNADSSRDVVALLAGGWTADELVRVAVEWVTSCDWRSDPQHPTRRTPQVVFSERNRPALAALRSKASAASKQLRGSDIKSAPIEPITPREKQGAAAFAQRPPREFVKFAFDLRSQGAR